MIKAPPALPLECCKGKCHQTSLPRFLKSSLKCLTSELCKNIEVSLAIQEIVLQLAAERKHYFQESFGTMEKLVTKSTCCPSLKTCLQDPNTHRRWVFAIFACKTTSGEIRGRPILEVPQSFKLQVQ